MPVIPRKLTILDAIANPNVFRPWFRDEASWAAWRAFLAALFGLPMSPSELATYREFTGRTEPPTTQAREAWMIVGRRGGKSLNLAALAVFVGCFGEFRQFIVPGERLLIPIIASERRQAKNIVGYCRAMLNNIPMFKKMLIREVSDSFELNNGLTIEIVTASFRSARGFSSPLILFDEIAFLFSEDTGSSNPDTEILRALKPSLGSIPNSMMLCASSPYAKTGEMWKAYKRHYGMDGDPVLIWKAPTWKMNPSFAQSEIDAAFAADPASASAEYGAEFRSDIASFVDREIVSACVETGCRERPFVSGRKYKAFCDPSGGSSDSFTLSIAHQEGENTVIDCLREIPAPFSPPDAVKELTRVLKSYRLNSVVGDRYAGEWVVSVFRENGIRYVHSELTRSEIYLEFLPLLNSRKVKLLDHQKTINQICNLERRTARSGKDSIDHPPGSHDDSANSVAGAATLITAPKNTVSSISWEEADYLWNSDNFATDLATGERKFVGPPPRFVPHPGSTRGGW